MSVKRLGVVCGGILCVALVGCTDPGRSGSSGDGVFGGGFVQNDTALHGTGWTYNMDSAAGFGAHLTLDLFDDGTFEATEDRYVSVGEVSSIEESYEGGFSYTDGRLSLTIDGQERWQNAGVYTGASYYYDDRDDELVFNVFHPQNDGAYTTQLGGTLGARCEGFEEVGHTLDVRVSFDDGCAFDDSQDNASCDSTIEVALAFEGGEEGLNHTWDATWSIEYDDDDDGLVRLRISDSREQYAHFHNAPEEGPAECALRGVNFGILDLHQPSGTLLPVLSEQRWLPRSEEMP